MVIEQLTREEVVAEAWQLRQSLERRLILNAIERARLERMLTELDTNFAGETLPNNTFQED